MKKQISKEDRAILETFLKNRVPSSIKEKELRGLDLMECYEELFSYATDLLDGCFIDTGRSPFGVAPPLIFRRSYSEVIFDLAKDSDDAALKIHCYLSLAVVSVVEVYG